MILFHISSRFIMLCLHGVFTLTAGHTWTYTKGAIEAGHDCVVKGLHSLAEAKAICANSTDCKGITCKACPNLCQHLDAANLAARVRSNLRAAHISPCALWSQTSRKMRTALAQRMSISSHGLRSTSTLAGAPG